jgi:hypothetical protein
MRLSVASFPVAGNWKPATGNSSLAWRIRFCCLPPPSWNEAPYLRVQASGSNLCRFTTRVATPFSTTNIHSPRLPERTKASGVNGMKGLSFLGRARCTAFTLEEIHICPSVSEPRIG